MDKLPDELQQRLSGVEINLPNGISLTPNVIQAVAIVFLIFVLVVTLAQLRKKFAVWSVRGLAPGIGFGIALTLIAEGFLLIGGRTLLTELLGWHNAPPAIVGVLDAGRNKLVDVLGVNKEVPVSTAEDISFEKLKLQYEQLTPSETSAFCTDVCRVK